MIGWIQTPREIKQGLQEVKSGFSQHEKEKTQTLCVMAIKNKGDIQANKHNSCR